MTRSISVCVCFLSLAEEKVEAIAREGKYQHLIIESTGISDPTPVAEALVTSEGSSESIIYSSADASNGGVATLGRGTPFSVLSLPHDPAPL